MQEYKDNIFCTIQSHNMTQKNVMYHFNTVLVTSNNKE